MRSPGSAGQSECTWRHIIQHTIVINEFNETVTALGTDMVDVERLSVAGEKVMEYLTAYSPANP